MPDALSLHETQQHLASFIPHADQDVFTSLKHAQLEGAFVGRIFIVYKAAGPNGEPRILTRLRVEDFTASSKLGPAVLIKDTNTGDTLWVDTVPTRLWSYPLFMQIPPNVTLRWTMGRHGEALESTLLFGIVTKMENRSEGYTAGAIYCLTPKRLRDLYQISINEPL